MLDIKRKSATEENHNDSWNSKQPQYMIILACFST